MCEPINSPMAGYERPEYDPEVAALHGQLNETALKAVWAEGRAMTMGQAIEYALSG